MIERLVDLVVDLWGSLAPFFVLNEYEGGVVLRLGRYSRTVGPGPHWKIPFIEEVLDANTVPTTIELRSQTLTTACGKSVVISSIVKYEIRDVQPFLLGINDAMDVLSDTTLGAIKECVEQHEYAELVGIESEVARKVRAEVNRYGFKIYKVTFADMGLIRSIRLLTDSGFDSSGDDD